MTSPEAVDAWLLESELGVVTNVITLQMGLSGSGVYAISTTRGEYVLRVETRETSERDWSRQLRVWRRAADAGIAPAIVHIDEAARAVVSARAGVPLAAALADSGRRSAIIGDVIAQLRRVHSLEAGEVDVCDPAVYARAGWSAQRSRPGCPVWAAELGRAIDAAAAHLADDPRLVVSHNDMNPGNALWDGERVWLIDWAVAGLTHPFYDVATFATFLDMDAQASVGLLGAQEQRALEPVEEATLVALCDLVAIAAGSALLATVPDLEIGPVPSVDEIPTLTQFYAQLRAGSMDLTTALARRAFGLTLLRRAMR